MSFLALILGLALAPSADQAELDRRLAALETADVGRWNEAYEALADTGSEAALRALETFGQADVQGARSRARLVVEVGTGACIAPVLQRLENPDPEVREAFVRFLGGFALGEEQAGERVTALTARARGDASRRVRRSALRGLSRSGLPGAAQALDALLDELERPDRALGVEALVACPGARGRVVARVLVGFEAPLVAADPEGFPRLVRAYGSALADSPRGGSSPHERVPFVLGRAHPDARVRGAARLSLDRMLDRLVELGENERADELLADLGREGLGAREVLYRRSVLALAVRGEPAAATRFAAELLRTSGGDGGMDRTWRFYAQLFGAAAELADGRPEGSYAGFLRARDTLNGLVAEREDLRPRIQTRAEYPIAPLGGAVVVDRLQLTALVEAWLALARFEERATRGEDPVDPAGLAHLREAHRKLLEAQLFALERDADFSVSHALDDVLERELSPRRLLLSNRELPVWRNGSGIDLQILLARGFATVAPGELPGFEPFEPFEAEEGPLTDPYLDDERFALLQRIQAADLEAARRAWLHERGRLFERSREEGDPSLVDRQSLLGHPLRFQLLDAQRRVRATSDRLRAAGVRDELPRPKRRELYRELAEYRPPSEYALTLAGELRQDGRAAEARRLSERMLAAVRDDLEGATMISTEIMSARIELSISSSYTDEDRPQEAEEQALAAVKRLEAFENTIERRLDEEDDPALRARLERSLRQVRRMRANALLSLAVNANVRAGDPEAALGYFEEAYELDERDFMRALLACYRARSGKREEALAVLRTVQPAPPLYYNLACTHALLGDADTALDFLRRELDENHPAEGSRRRQKEWAREDPDLASLRGDPRFERLVGE